MYLIKFCYLGKQSATTSITPVFFVTLTFQRKKWQNLVQKKKIFKKFFHYFTEIDKWLKNMNSTTTTGRQKGTVGRVWNQINLLQNLPDWLTGVVNSYSGPQFPT